MKTRRYPSWGEFLKKSREKRFRSAREFCATVDLGISYPQYSRYEAGEQLPPLDQALGICKMLGTQVVEALLEWNRAQISDSEARVQVEVLLQQHRGSSANERAAVAVTGQAGAGHAGAGHVPLDDVIVFNRSHLRLFSSDPAYRDIFTYINSFSPEWITSGEIASALGIAPRKMAKMLDALHDLGVIVRDGSRDVYRASKRNFYFPDDADFFGLRNLNLLHNARSIMDRLSHADVSGRRAFRGLISRELTAAQLELVLEQLDEFMSRVVALPETAKPEKIYSVCALVGERFARGTKPSLLS